VGVGAAAVATGAGFGIAYLVKEAAADSTEAAELIDTEITS